MSAFARFPPRLQQALVARLGWTALRPVQDLAGEAILDGKNVIVLAPTAGGKTEAAIFPVLAGLLDRPAESVGAIYIAPIKALLNNQDERLGTYTEMVGLRRFVWHGDVKDADRKRFSREPADLLMTTPESLEVMLVSPRVPTNRLFSDLRVVIIDEVHALAGTDRGAHLLSVVERIVRSTENDVQRIGLSATVGNPEAILAWLKGTSRRPGEVVDPPKQPSKRQIGILCRPTMLELAREAAHMASGKKSLFFCQSRSLTETVAEHMRSGGTEVFVHHSSVSLEERRAAEESFHHGSNVCIACTSTLELGIDVGDLDAVFQANAPSTVSSFLQRMGRTGRRPGTVANMTFFCESAEEVLQAIALVELARAGRVESITPRSRCWPVLVHQLLAMALQFGGVSVERCWEQISRVPDFRGIARDEFDRVIGHLLREDYLFESGGLLSLGSRAERVYGRKNFFELYAVFSSPVLYTVKTQAGREIGSLEQDFVDQLVEEMTSFLLGGRAWTARRIDHGERIIHVTEAPRGKKPSWGGFIPQMLGFELCQEMRRVLVEETEYPYLHPTAAAALKEKREELGPLLRRRARPVQVEAGTAWWWTLAGGRINSTLKYGLEVLGGWKVVADNVALRIEGDGVTHGAIDEVAGRMADNGFWRDEAIWRTILARLPAFRLSKFQRALPEGIAVELVGAYLLDADGTRGYLGGLGSGHGDEAPHQGTPGT
jgi:ATP-dependent Lhr-like helicase